MLPRQYQGLVPHAHSHTLTMHTCTTCRLVVRFPVEVRARARVPDQCQGQLLVAQWPTLYICGAVMFHTPVSVAVSKVFHYT